MRHPPPSPSISPILPQILPNLPQSPQNPPNPPSPQSAVLAAIQICLGAGARRTNRAKTLAKLINNHGKATHAKLQVKLLNKGSDSFQHDVYGDYITVERILDKSGGSNYRLLDSKDKVRIGEEKKSM